MFGFRGHLNRRTLDDRFVRLDQEIKIVDRDKRVPLGSRHIRIDCCDDQFRGLARTLHNIHGYPEAAHSVHIRRGYLNERHIQVDLAAAKKTGYVGQENQHDPFISGF